jgi:adenylate cyclase
MRAAARSRLRTILFLSVGLGLTALGVVAYATDSLADLERDTVDQRFSIRGEQEPPKDLVVVKIDDVTFDELRPEFPFPRRMHARVIDRIAADSPKVIAYDVQFSEKGPVEGQDFELAEAIFNAKGRVVLATTEVNEKGEGTFIGAPENVLREDLGGRLANGLFPNDPGGVIRRVSFEVDELEAFSVAAVEVATGRQVDAGQFGGEAAWIDYVGPPDTIDSVSFSRVLRGRTPKGFFRDKLVVVGPHAPSLQDVHPTSTSGDENMAGAEIQASAIDTVRRGLPLERASAGLEVPLIVLLGLVAPLASLRFSALRALALAIALGGIYVIAAQLAFNDGTILSFVYPIGTLVLVSIGVLAVHYVTAAFERERVRDMFSRFVPENVVDDVIKRSDGLRLGGVQREATVMFSDLRGFTSFAEALEPDQVISILNRYLTAMVDDAILPHGGTLVDYMGDGIMAVFGAPIEMDDHADRALAAARAKLVELEKFNEWLRTEMGFEKSFQMGIGLNSGSVMSGNVGSEKRLAYTAIGDTTNTAARLEAMTKNTPYMILVSDSTRAELSAEPEDVVFVDEMEVRGRQQKVKLWSVGQSTKEGQAGETFQSVSGDSAATAAPPQA